MQKKVQTYIRNFDDELQGGILYGNTVVFSGEAGTLKTSVALNILIQEANSKRKNGLFISLAQDLASLRAQLHSLGLLTDNVNVIFIRDLSKFGYEIEKAKHHSKGNVIVVGRRAVENEALTRQEHQNKNWINVIKNIMKKSFQEIQLHHFVLDSTTVLQSLSQFNNPFLQLSQLAFACQDVGITSFFIAEQNRKEKELVEDLFANTIIDFKHAPYRRKLLTEITALKTHATKTSHDTFTLQVENGVFVAHHGGQEPLL